MGRGLLLKMEVLIPFIPSNPVAAGECFGTQRPPTELDWSCGGGRVLRHSKAANRVRPVWGLGYSKMDFGANLSASIQPGIRRNGRHGPGRRVLWLVRLRSNIKQCDWLNTYLFALDDGGWKQGSLFVSAQGNIQSNMSSYRCSCWRASKWEFNSLAKIVPIKALYFWAHFLFGQSVAGLHAKLEVLIR
jgi:hypothetical protein